MAGLIGHTEILEKMLGYAKNNKLAGSWIFSGLYGVGKGYTARLLAEKLLGENTANLKIIARDLSDVEKTALIKLSDDGNSLAPNTASERAGKAEITVNDIRTLEAFTSYKSLDDTPKIIIIDSVDELNINAANALLKTLEEPPPNTVMILISHQPQKLLPTIKSRCKVVKFMPIGYDDMREHLFEMFGTVKDIELIIQLANGSIGKAYDIIANDGAVLYSDIVDGLVMGSVPSIINKNNIDVAFELLFTALNRLVKHQSNANDTLPVEASAFDVLAMPTYKLITLINDSTEKYNKSKFLYLDKAALMDNIFFNLKRLK